MQLDMVETLRKLGNDLTLTTYRCKNYEQDPAFERAIDADLASGGYDCVFSFNYFPIISNVCENRDTPYLSWVFDAPCLNLLSNTLANSCNVVFHFDRQHCEWLRQMGHRNVHHLPLAVNASRIDALLAEDAERPRYTSDVSFVGRLYDKKNLYDDIKRLSDYLKGYFDGVMQAQKLIYDSHFLYDVLTDDVMNELRQYVHLDLGKSFFFDERFVFANLFLAQKTTSLERIQILRNLSESMDVHLYSDSGQDVLPRAKHMGGVDSDHGAPLVFHHSKINLNVTLRSIQSGIPLRIFDIMGAGGFVISNYQSELADHFVIGEDVVVYEDLDDLAHKAAYYLAHDKEREAIARNGYEKIRASHTFEARIEKMFEQL